MNDNNRINESAKLFDVHVGYARVRVEAESQDDAIRVARQAFCREMPRMWDVICSLTAQRFIVQPATR